MARKTSAAKTAGRKAAPREAASKKTASKKTASKKTASKKTASKKAASKKAASKKAAPRKAAPKKAASRKATPKKGAGRERAPTTRREQGAGPQAAGMHRRRAERTGEAQRERQPAQEKRRARREQREGESQERSAQLGQRTYPANPLPEQHLEKPGLESDLTPRPYYQAPAYRGSGKLQDRVALITGADSGIGRAVAVLFAREGADIAIAYLDEHADAEETRDAVHAEGRQAILIPGDVADPDYARHAVERTVRELGGLDILVNNAAYQQHQKALEDITDEQLERTFRTNIFGYFHMTRAALAHLGRGSVIINSSSVTAVDGSAELIDYAATKGAIHAFTRSLALNLLSRGIRVNGVAPGPVWTPLNPADLDAEDVAGFGSSVPMKRPAQPEEIAPSYVFLAAPTDSSYITGEFINVFGGKPAP